MGYASYSAEYINATLDDVRIWNRVLTAQEVSELYVADESYPVVVVSPDSLIFQTRVGQGNPPTQLIYISNAGQGAMNYTITTSAPWLFAEPDSGGPVPPIASVSIGVDASGLPGGTHLGKVIVTAGHGVISDTVTVLVDNAYASIGDSLVASYPFGGNADDVSGNANNGTVTGAVLDIGHTGLSDHAYYFDGDDDCITVPDSPSLDMSGPISISLWLKLPTIPTHGMMLIGKSDYVSHTNYLMVLLPGNVFRWEYNRYCDVTIPSLQVGHWYHVVVTAESATGSKQMFVGGQLQTLVPSGSPGSHGIVTAPLTIGCMDGGSSRLNGTLDDLRIWKRVLTPQEVSELYGADEGDPIVGVSPDTLVFEAQLYQDDPLPQTIYISNAGLDLMHYTISATAPWLVVEPESGGPVPPGASASVGVDLSELEAGVYHEHVIVSSTEGGRYDAVDVTVTVHDPRVGLTGTDAVIQWSLYPYGFGDSLYCVVGPGPEYYAYGEDIAFRTEEAVDIGDDVVSATQNIWYTGTGGGSIYGMYIRIGGLDLTACGPIAGVQVLHAAGASLYEYGPDYVILHVNGGCAGWGCPFWGPYHNHVAVRLIATHCGVCCDGSGNCTTCTEEECAPPNVWHETVFDCVPGFCATAGLPTVNQDDEGLLTVTPCPSGTSTTLTFGLAGPRRMTLTIFDVRGREVRSFDLGEIGPGTHTVEWDGKDSNGMSVASGVYCARLSSGERVWRKTIVRIK
jgi:hypothetical protein